MSVTNIQCNLASVFAQFNTIDDIKAVANNICAQVKEAYEVRYKEIKSGKSGVVVEIIPLSDNKKVKDKSIEPSPAKATKSSKAEKNVKAAKKEPKAKSKGSDAGLISLTDTEAIKKLGLTFEKYNDNCWALRGNTKPLRAVLKDQFKGVFNSYLKGGAGWAIKNENVEACAKALGLKVKVA